VGEELGAKIKKLVISGHPIYICILHTHTHIHTIYFINNIYMYIILHIHIYDVHTHIHTLHIYAFVCVFVCLLRHKVGVCEIVCVRVCAPRVYTICVHVMFVCLFFVYRTEEFRGGERCRSRRVMGGSLDGASGGTWSEEQSAAAAAAEREGTPNTTHI